MSAVTPTNQRVVEDRLEEDLGGVRILTRMSFRVIGVSRLKGWAATCRRPEEEIVYVGICEGITIGELVGRM